MLDTGGRAVRDDVVHLPACTFQILSRFLVFLRAGLLLFPPGSMVDPEGRPFGIEPLELLEKLGIVQLQDAVLDIVAAGSAHGEDPFSAHVKHLPALQQEHRGADAANLPAVPVLQWVCPQGVIVFVVPRNEEGGKGPVLQEV